MFTGDATKDWKTVDTLENQGLPQSALEVVEKIYQQAKNEKNSPQLLKSLIFKAKFITQREEDGFEKSILMMEAELPQLTFPADAVLHSMLGEMYENYLSQNAWQIRERTPLAAGSPGDLLTWSIQDIENQAFNYYLKSLDDEQGLKKVPVGEFQEIILNGRNDTLTVPLRPTLFDFLAFRAIEYASNTNHFLTEPEYKFELTQPEAYAPLTDFVKTRFETRDNTSRKWLAIRLFQRVLAAHADDSDASNRTVADLHRLKFVHQHSNIENNNQRYEEALRQLIRRVGNHPAQSEVLFDLAAAIFDWSSQDEKNNRLPEVVKICREVVEKYPKTLGARRCQELLAQIMRSELGIQSEKYLQPNQPFLVKIDFKNNRKVWAKIVAFDHQNPNRGNDHEMNDSRKFIQKLNNLPILQSKTWDFVGAPEDFQRHSTEMFWDGLPLGNYVIMVSENENFDPDKSQVSLSNCTVTQLAVVHFKNENNEIFVATDRNTGQPKSGVKLEFFRQDWQQGKYNSIKIGETDTQNDGTAVFKSSENYGGGVFATAKLGNDLIVLNNFGYFNYYESSGEFRNQVRIFTDRAIYRPGQMVYFKAIALQFDKNGNPKIIRNQKLEFHFRDVNAQEKARISLTTNEFGSCHGVFTAPSTGLTGQMAIVCANMDGGASFSVEEYKRPKFEVVFEPVKETFKLGQPVKVRGKALNFSGVPVADAPVKFTVNRQANFPVWDWRMFRGGVFPHGNNRQIASGEILTDANGNFEVEFLAEADLNLDKKWKPNFDFTVRADVTDGTGETQFASKTVSIGYVSLKIDLNLPESIALDSLKNIQLNISNLANEPQKVVGNIEITRLLVPDKNFKIRLWENPDIWTISEGEYRRLFPKFAYKNEEKVENWGRQDFSKTINFDLTQKNAIDFSTGMTAPGWYEIKLSTRDIFGEMVEIKKVVEVQGNNFSQPDVRFLQKTATQQEVLFGTHDGTRHFFVATKSLGNPLKINWLSVSPQQKMSIPITDLDKGGIGFNWFSVHDSRMISGMSTIDVPRPEKDLDIQIESFRDKLAPGQAEEWRIKISGKNKDRAAAELLATMYDASLEQFVRHNFPKIIFPTFWNDLQWSSEQQFSSEYGQTYTFNYAGMDFDGSREFQRLNWYDLFFGGYQYNTMRGNRKMVMMDAAVEMAAPTASEAPRDELQTAGNQAFVPPTVKKDEGETRNTPPPVIRKNLQELVFFYPDLRTDAQGNLILKFKMNEALTRWKFLAMAHTQELATGLLEKEVITQKELMIQANPPRFFREGDELVLSAKVSNLTNREISGTATLQLRDAITEVGISADFDLKNDVQKVKFNIAAGSSMPVFWKLKVPTGKSNAIIWQVMATAGNLSDGEENALPVVTNRMLVTETMPLNLRGNQTQTFDFQSIANTKSASAQPHKFTLEFTSNPVWYAVQSLPYLMEYPHDCSEQVFNRFYANALAQNIVQKLPNIRRVFEKWKGDPKALQSNLSKNQELKSALLEDTPWVLDAQSESQQKQNIALLFDLNRMASEREKALDVLKNRQNSDGGWSWFPGGPSNDYITAYILSGMMKLDVQLGVLPNSQNDPIVGELLRKAAQFVAKANEKRYHDIEKWIQEGKAKWEDDHLDGSTIFNLYALSNTQFGIESQKVRKFFLEQAAQHWLNKDLYAQGMLALILKRAGNADAAQKIIASLRERAIQNPELGMYWKQEWGWWWYQLPIETQSLMVEVFDEVAKDRSAVENLRIWLLKNKQTNRWSSTKATAEAVTALLLHGDNWLENNKLVKIDLGKQPVKPQEVEAGTGYFKNEWSGNDIRPDFSKIKVENPNSNIVWGAAYYHYFENLDKIQHFQKTPLTIVKQYFKEETTPSGKKLVEISEKTALKVGDRVKVRIEVRVDRPMEFVHLKDMRPAGTEPVNVLSGYRYQDGLGYYESTKDLASHFFMDYLPRGTFVFEYVLLASMKGNFSSGITTLQSMYAPEFSSHSEGSRLTIN